MPALALSHLHKGAILHLNSILCQCFDVPGFNGSFPFPDWFEEVPAWSQTEPLLPHTVRWGEVFFKLLSE